MVKIEEVKPILDANLNDEERKELRAQRAAAAEQRLQQKGLKQPKKKKKDSSKPLRGPNSENLMRWTTG